MWGELFLATSESIVFSKGFKVLLITGLEFSLELNYILIHLVPITVFSDIVKNEMDNLAVKTNITLPANKNLDYYLELPYKYTLYPAEEGGYVIKIPDFPGCISQGETAEEALFMIEDAKRGWLEVALDQGIAISEPSRLSSDFSGKFSIRGK